MEPEETAVSEIANAGLVGVSALVHQMLVDYREQAKLFHGMHRDLQDVAKEVAALAREVSKLTKILLDGNGRPSLMERTALLEQSVEEHQDCLRTLTARMDTRIADEGAQRRALVVVLAGGVVTVLCTILTIVFAFFKH